MGFFDAIGRDISTGFHDIFGGGHPQPVRTPPPQPRQSQPVRTGGPSLTLQQGPVNQPRLNLQAPIRGPSTFTPYNEGIQQQHPSIFANPVFKTIENITPAYNIYEATRGLFGDKQAENTAKQNTTGFIRGNITRPVAEAADTLRHPFSQNNFTPKGKVEQTLFGKTPVQNIQKKVVNTYQTHKGGGALPLAVGEAAGSILQDVPDLKGVGEAAKGAKFLAGKRMLLDEAGAVGKKATPLANMGDKQLNAAYHAAKTPADKQLVLAEMQHRTDQVTGGKPLPENHAKYFDTKKANATVPLEKIQPTKAPEENVKGGINATRFMAHTAAGKMAPRDPVLVEPMSDGSYRVLDGNGTTTAAKAQGWKSLPVQVTSQKTFNDAQALKDKATQANPEFQKTMNDLAKSFGLNYKEGPVKGLSRIIRKGDYDYKAEGGVSNVKDALRGTLIVENPRQIQDLVSAIGKRLEVIRVKNGYEGDMPGYKDIKVNVRTKNGTVGEVLMATPEMLRAKSELGGHDLYEMSQNTTDTAKLQQLHEQMNKLYGEADAAAERRLEAKRLASAAGSSLPSTSALAGGKGLPPLSTKPETLPGAVKRSSTTTSSTSKYQGPGSVKKFAMEPPSTSIIAEKAGSINRRQLTGKALSKTNKELSSKPPEPPKVKTPTLNTTGAGKTKFSRFTNVSIPKSEEVSAGLKKEIATDKATYVGTSNKTHLAASKAFLDRLGPDKAVSDLYDRLATEQGKIDDQTVSDAIATIKALDARNKPEDFTTAHNLSNSLAEHLSAHGQAVQAASLLSHRTPEGILYSVRKTLTQGKAKMTPKLEKDVKTIYDRIKTTKQGSDERSYAIQDMQRLVAENVKSKLADKALGLWRTGLLTGPQTATKVLLSHGVMNVAEKVKDVPAVALDRAISLFSKQRSTSFTMRGTAKGAKEGTVAAGRLLFKNHDQPGTSGFQGSLGERFLANGKDNGRATYGKSIVGKGLNFYTRKVAQVHAAMPKPFYRSAYVNDLYKQAKAAASKVPLENRKQFIKDFVNNPSEEVMNQAHLAAQYATFQQPTFLGKQASAFQKVPGGKALAPFAHIASAILTDAKNYSPIGAMQAVYDAVKASKTGWTPAIQKQLVEGVGRGVTGTGVIALGSLLFNRGIITTGYPTDKKEQALWKAEGKQENSIKINGAWRRTDALGPLGSMLSAGALLAQSKTTNPQGKSNAQAAFAGALQNVSSQSYLSGLTEASGALQNPTQNLNAFLKLEAGSVVPVGVATAARATDNKQRVMNTPAQSVEAKIPGLRQNLPVSTDMFGRQLSRNGGVWTNFLDPTRPTFATKDPVTNELQRLVGATGTQGVPVPAAPTKISGKNAAGKTVSLPLTKQMQQEFMVSAGPQVRAAFQQIINNPNYASQSDDVKNKALSDAYTNIMNIQKQQYLVAHMKDANIKLTAAQVAIKAGNNPDYIANAKIQAAGGTAINLNKSIKPADRSVLNKVAVMNSTAKKSYLDNPKNKYSYDVASFHNDQLNGKYDPVQAFAKEQSLAKEAVTSNFPKEVTELYGKSKAEITAYLKTDPKHASQLENQLYGLDNALVDAGIKSTKKFKYGITSSGKSGSRGGKGGASKMAGGYPVFKAPGTFGNTYTDLNSLLVKTERRLSAPHIRISKGSSKKYSIKTPKFSRRPAAPKFPKPRTASFSTSKKSGQRVKLSV